MKRILTTTGLFLGACFLLSAQETGNNRLVIERKMVERADSWLVVDMTVDLSSLKVASDRSIQYLPTVRRGDSLAVLPQFIVNGRARHILYERMDRDRMENNEFEVYRKNGTEQRMDYHARVEFRDWMKKSELMMAIDTCGCGWEAIGNGEASLFPINIGEPFVLAPLMAYITPEAEAVKVRAKEGSAYLDFPVNKIEIYPEYRNNPLELKKIRETIESVRNDKYATITEVSIKGYASPEGSYANNAYLAEHRAKALSGYVQGLYDFGSAKMLIDFEPEDWAGLEKRLQTIDVEAKDELLAVVRADEPKDLDKKEWKLRQVAGGAPYRYILQTVYPALRHSDYVVQYKIRNFTADEAKELLYSDPKQLSLNEMFQVAQTYEPGSDAFCEVFEIAVRMFPDDPVSNLNAANTALQLGRIDQARRYLAKAPDSPQKRLAEAVALLLEGNLDDAETIFRALENEPSVKEQAIYNQQQVKQKREELN